MHPRISFLRALCAATTLSLLVFAGCSSDRGPKRGPDGERLRKANPMAGQAQFFNGQLLAKVTVSNKGMPKPGAGGGGQSGSEGERRERGGGRPPRGGGGMGPGGGGGGFGGGPGGSEGPSARPLMAGQGGVPQIIHVSFTNQGSTRLEIWISDFTSLLGNFAVRPEKLVLEPGQTLFLDAMTTQLGGRYSEVDATLVLRVGENEERKTFRLHETAELAGDPPPAS
ncbi:hypothetical protein [Oleiharenicola lentus]|uniref:hypothetical protein n=1 Tax=Oleiharenicola lentus TaxID=2508720 RepID=UPI003F68125A